MMNTKSTMDTILSREHNNSGQGCLSALPFTMAILVACFQASAVAAELGIDCKSIDDDSVRLTCYDRLSGRAVPQKRESLAPTEPIPIQASKSDIGTSSLLTNKNTPPALTLANTWELNAADKRGTFKLLPHKLNYLLPARYSTSPNVRPNSPTRGGGLNTDLPIQATEAKFQFSFKTKAWENIFGDNGDLWLGYTQQSNWQLYNNKSGVSAAFRESNYEPEAILALRTDRNVLGWHWQMLNLGFVHQSNGHALPLSRSWNRVYAQFGFERDNFTILARPWIRVPERSSRDDNPDIHKYMGSGDLRVAYHRAGHVLSALGRYSLSDGHGALQLEWAFPISGALHGYVQAISGYGESLVDYNHAQTTLGVGILLLPWQ